MQKRYPPIIIVPISVFWARQYIIPTTVIRHATRKTNTIIFLIDLPFLLVMNFMIQGIYNLSIVFLKLTLDKNLEVMIPTVI